MAEINVFILKVRILSNEFFDSGSHSFLSGVRNPGSQAILCFVRSPNIRHYAADKVSLPLHSYKEERKQSIRSLLISIYAPSTLSDSLFAYAENAPPEVVAIGLANRLTFLWRRYWSTERLWLRSFSMGSVIL